jgi:hypothetical protein
MRVLRGAPAMMAVALLSAAVWVGCGSCGSRPLAELLEGKGAVERDHSASVGTWLVAESGASFEAGDGLRTGSNATALLRIGRKGRAQVESDTTIRFSRGKGARDDAPAALEIEQGQAQVEAGEEALLLRTELGQAILSAGAKLAVTRAEGGTRYRVLVGGATFDGENGRTNKLAAGESIMIGLGMAVFEPMPTTQAAHAAAAATQAAAAQVDAAVEQAAVAPESVVTATVKGVVRRRGADDETWSPLGEGTSSLGVDDELDVGASAQASVLRGNERAVLSEGRYQIGASDAPLVRALSGNFQIEAGEGDSVRISVPGGTITALAVAGGTKANVSVRAKDGHTDIQVERGQVAASGGETKLAIAKGERGELAALAPEPAADTAVESSIDRAELIVQAGEFFRVYDPKPPTAVGFKVAKLCGAGGAEVRVEGEPPVRGTEQVNVAIGPGIHDYTVHCLEAGEPLRKPAIRTKLRIVRNDGARKLPTTPPKNDVALDGRRYTLMYQNLKPILTATWRDAPKAAGYVLHITSPRGATRSLRTGQPQLVIPSDALKDGTHRLQFETQGKTKTSSKETLVDVMFDNAAPTASLELPPAGGFANGSSVNVAGVVVEGSRVSVLGKDLALDGQQRFRDQVALRGTERAIAVRVQHPRHGIRYYLRRAIR